MKPYRELFEKAVDEGAPRTAVSVVPEKWNLWAVQSAFGEKMMCGLDFDAALHWASVRGFVLLPSDEEVLKKCASF